MNFLSTLTVLGALMCRKLKACADSGDYNEAERVLIEMRQDGHLPGPRAYHALIFSYVKGDNPRGALEAIRTEVNAGGFYLGTTLCALLPAHRRAAHTYVAWFLVQACNRCHRATRLSYTGSSVKGTCPGLKRCMHPTDGQVSHATQAGQPSQLDCSEQGPMKSVPWPCCSRSVRVRRQPPAIALVKMQPEVLHLHSLHMQGEEEGLRPDNALYESLIKYLCRQGQLEGALQRVVEMQERGVAAEKDHFSSLVTAHALSGQIDGAMPAEGVRRQRDTM